LETNQQKHKAEEKAKFEDLKAKLDACFKDNGCTPPVKSPEINHRKGNATEKNGPNVQCRKALRESLKTNFESCVQKAVPGFVFPQKDGGKQEKHIEHHGFNFRDEKKALESCAKKQQVRDCKQALINGTRPTEDQKRARFQSNCQQRQSCLAALSTDCQSQLKQVKQATCQCHQQQQSQIDGIRSGIAACQGVQEKGKQDNNREKKETTCEQKDYCALGYEAFVADHQNGKGKGKGKGKGRN